MKRISLTQAEITSLETALIQYGTVITIDQLSKLFDDDRKYLRKRISKLTNQGWLTRIKKGIYAISDLSSRGSLPISHYAIANLLVENAYISFESALQYHGFYDQLLTRIGLISLKQYKSTRIDAFSYSFVKTKESYFYGWKPYQVDGQTVKIADTEKALIDLIQFHRNRYTVDLVIEKLQNYKDEFDLDRLITYSLKANIVTQRILGFLMDIFSLDTNKLFDSVAKKQGISIITKSENRVYNNKWKLYYSEYFSQYT